MLVATLVHLLQPTWRWFQIDHVTGLYALLFADIRALKRGFSQRSHATFQRFVDCFRASHSTLITALSHQVVVVLINNLLLVAEDFHCASILELHFSSSASDSTYQHGRFGTGTTRVSFAGLQFFSGFKRTHR